MKLTSRSPLQRVNPTRRTLLQGGLLLFANRALAQSPPAASQKALVVIFLRGGVDGLSMVPPHGDPAYAALRPTLRLLPPGAGGDDAALPLDGQFGLHPAMAALAPLYASQQLAVLHAVGQQSPSRSHFDAQDFLESGLAGQRGPDGWLNRALAQLPLSDSAFRAVAVQNGVPYSLQGAQPVVTFPSLRDFRVGAANASSFEALYASAVDEALRTRGAEAFTGMSAVKGLASAAPQHGAVYPQAALGKRLADVGRLIHADVGLRVAVTEAGGFDTHLGQGAGKGQLGAKLRELSDAMAAFAVDLGPERLNDVCVVTMTEFGRTARENGTRGTDHGTASAMLVLGGGVKGGRVVTRWPGLQGPALVDGRDLRATTDVRAVLAEVLDTHLELADVGAALPGVARTKSLWA